MRHKWLDCEGSMVSIKIRCLNLTNPMGMIPFQMIVLFNFLIEKYECGGVLWAVQIHSQVYLKDPKMEMLTFPPFVHGLGYLAWRRVAASLIFSAASQDGGPDIMAWLQTSHFILHPSILLSFWLYAGQSVQKTERHCVSHNWPENRPAMHYVFVT